MGKDIFLIKVNISDLGCCRFHGRVVRVRAARAFTPNFYANQLYLFVAGGAILIELIGSASAFASALGQFQKRNLTWEWRCTVCEN
jgi:hypothetical protein